MKKDPLTLTFTLLAAVALCLVSLAASGPSVAGGRQGKIKVIGTAYALGMFGVSCHGRSTISRRSTPCF
jgi:hypothetical protein